MKERGRITKIGGPAMTPEEAIKVFEDYLGPDDEYRYESREVQEMCEAVEVAIAALCPVSWERVARMFPGCPHCKPDSEGYVQKFGAYSIQNGELETGHCKPQKISFCPHCSRPLTDEAVDIRLKELEALKDGKDQGEKDAT